MMMFSIAMKYRKLASKIIGLCFGVTFTMFLSCSNDACKEPMNTSMQVLFYSKPGNVLMAMDTFSIYAVKNNELFPTEYIDTVGLYQVNLHLDYTDTISRFFFKSKTVRDTFIVVYSNKAEFVSAECGSRIVSVIDTFYYGRGRYGDSIAIKHPSVAGVYNGKNVEIYFD